MTTEVVDFIKLAEAHMKRVLRTRDQEVRETFTLNSEYTDLTTLTNTVKELRNIQLNTDPIRRLEYRTPDKIDKEWPNNDSGKPVFYTIIGDELQVKPVPDSSYTAEVSIVSPFTSLSGGSPTNWILTNHPDIYLAGALYYGNKYIKDQNEADRNLTEFLAHIKTLNRQEKRARYSGSKLKMQPARTP